MPDCDHSNEQFAIIDLIDDAVVADADAPGVTTFRFLQPGGRGSYSRSSSLSSMRVAMAFGNLLSCFFRFMEVKGRNFRRVIFLVVSIIIVVYGIKIIRGVRAAHKSNAELYPFTHSFPTEDSALFAKKYLPSIEVDEIAHISGRDPISLFTFGRKYEIITYRIDLLESMALKEVLNLSKQGESETVRVSYLPVKFEDFTFECHIAPLFPVRRIFISFSDEITKVMENDTILSCQLSTRRFSVKYEEEGPVDILIEGDAPMPFVQHTVSMDLLLLRKANAVFLFIMTPIHRSTSIEPDLLYKIVTGN